MNLTTDVHIPSHLWRGVKYRCELGLGVDLLDMQDIDPVESSSNPKRAELLLRVGCRRFGKSGLHFVYSFLFARGECVFRS